MTKRPTLKEIKDVLNKIPESTLAVTSIAIDFALTDGPDGQFKIIWLADESEFSKHIEALELDKKDILKKFTDKLNKDLEQAKIRENEKGYDTEYNMDGDW